MENNQIKIYGTSWCGETRRARELFDINKIAYEWIDIDSDNAGAEYVKSVNNGNKSVPTIVFTDGTILVEPSTYALQEKIKTLS
jgi:mycoredoxin